MEIRQLKTEQEWLNAFPVMKDLREHLDEEKYLDYLREMLGQGYRMFALCIEGEIVALAGVIIWTNFYNGRNLYIHDLVAKPGARSKGYGAKLLSAMEEWGKDNGCEKVVLSSGLQRKDAHRFYEDKMNYDKVSYVFTSKL